MGKKFWIVMRWATLFAMWFWVAYWGAHVIQILIDWDTFKGAWDYYLKHNNELMWNACYSWLLAYWIKHAAIEGDM